MTHWPELPSLPVSIPIEPRMLMVIGALVTQWAFLEFEIDKTLLNLSRQQMDEDGAKVLRRPFAQKLDRWQEIAQRVVQDPQLLHSIARIAERAVAAQERRNLIVHGLYGSHNEVDGAGAVASTRDARIGRLVTCSFEEVFKSAEEISAISASLLKLYRDFPAWAAIQH